MVSDPNEEDNFELPSSSIKESWNDNLYLKKQRQVLEQYMPRGKVKIHDQELYKNRVNSLSSSQSLDKLLIHTKVMAKNGKSVSGINAKVKLPNDFFRYVYSAKENFKVEHFNLT